MYSLDSVIDFSHGDWGEDRIISLNKIFGTVDGATPIKATEIDGYRTEAEWMAEKFVSFLKVGEEDRANKPFPELCREFVNGISESGVLNGISVPDYPCLTLSVFVLQAKALHGYLLGDCELHVLMKNGSVISLTDKSSRKFSDLTCAAISRAKSLGESFEEASRAQRYENRKHINKEGGYYVLSPCGRFENGIKSVALPVSEIKAVLSCTDGYARLFGQESAPSPIDFLTRALTLKEGLKILRRKEKSSHFPNEVKRHDDASAVAMFFE